MGENINIPIKKTGICSKQDFFNLINWIAPNLDGWSIGYPLSGRKILKFISKESRKKAYRDFTIPKKSGGYRKISAPISLLKQIQSSINILLLTIFEPSPFATGFVIGKSIKDNAEFHRGQACIFNLDLENFFPSITKNMIRKALHAELGHILKSNHVINIICSLCTTVNSDGIEVLPQGAPTSPVLSNIVLKSFDNKVSSFAHHMGYKYSRYADDLTFSHNRPIRKVSEFFQQRIKSIIENSGLKINENKTRVLPLGKQQEVTGVIVSEKINVKRSYIKQLRILIHLWDKYGYSEAQRIFIKAFCKGQEKSLSKVIDGKINYLEMIKGKEDPTYIKYKRKYRKLVKSLLNERNPIHKS